MSVRALTLDDLEPYLIHASASSAESGRDGEVYFGPYSRDEPFLIDDQRGRTRERWTKSITTPGWRRAWGLYDGDRIVATSSLTGGELPAEMHRVRLGMAVLRGYRRQARGRRLLEATSAWCREQPLITWLDLGVFSDNVPARRFYESMGFVTIGVTRDRFRVDDVSIDDIEMTLRV